MIYSQYSQKILEELKSTLSQVSETDTKSLVRTILSSKRIFIAGAGRSGFMVKSFAMRLMHLGFDSYVVGETVTPNIQSGDCLLIGSGSGETGSLAFMAQKAKKIGAAVCLVTIFPESSIGRLSDVCVKIPAPTPKVEAQTQYRSIQPMGSLFEQSLLLFLDTVIVMLMEKRNMNSDEMFTRHANLE
jgi:6-phospho-3-hexuloisomerase